MNRLAQLRGQRDDRAKKVAALNAKYAADVRMTKEDADATDALLNEIEQIDGEITRETRSAALQIEASASGDGGIDERLLNQHTRSDVAKDEEKQAFRAFFVGGMQALSDQQRKIVAARVTQDALQAWGPVLPQQFAQMGIKGAMSTTTPAEGGYTVATEYYKQLEQALKAYGGVRDVATVIRTASGADMNFPTADATAEVGEIVGQNAAAASLDTTFGNAAISTYRYSSKKIALPWELIQDTFLDLEAYVADLLGMRIGRIQAQHHTTGTGTGQPKGIVTAAASGRVGTTGQTLTVIYDDLIYLEHSVNSLYRKLPGVGWMMADSSLGVVRRIKDSNGRPIFVPGYESSNPGGAPDRLLGRPITINDDMAAMAANAKSILFGCFKKYVVRDVMDLMLFRFNDSAFALNGQVGFCGFQRSGANLIDLSGATVKYYQNSAT